MNERPPHHGVFYGIAAYGLWGLIPLYFKSVAAAAPLEVLAHRAFWSFVMLVVLVGLLGRWRDVVGNLKGKRVLLLLGASTLLIAVNWLAFIYAVLTRQVIQASIGYFINPLVSVLLGTLLLRERLRATQMLSIAVAAVGVVILTSQVGHLPWIALALAGSFSLYGLVRKILPVDSLTSLAVETALMTPAALAYLGWLAASGRAAHGWPILGLLALAGPVTTVPLLFFGAAAKRLPLSTLGILQYLTPSLQFSLAVAAFHEPLSAGRLASFACVWTAVALYTADSLQARRKQRMALAEPAGPDL